LLSLTALLSLAGMAQAVRVDDKITCHAWNADRSLLAACPNSNIVTIYKVPSTADGTWDKVTELREHDALVTAVAWGPKNNKILTSAQDRNAYVWSLEGNEWKPMLVILRITAAATSVQWSPDEQKFAVGSGARTVPICYFEAENNFWVCKMLKGHNSTIQDVGWHPTAPIVATACTDYKCRVFSAYLKNVDGKNVSTPFGDNPKFGTMFFEIESPAWVRGVAFSPAGDTLAFCSHNSTVSFIDMANPTQPPQVVRLRDLPLTRLLFLPDGSMVGVGHCYDPILFTKAGGGWVANGKLIGKQVAAKATTGFSSARNMFQDQTAKGQGSAASSADQSVGSLHSNLVCGMQLFGKTQVLKDGPVAAEFSTSALDGKVAFWTRDEISAAMSAVAIS